MRVRENIEPMDIGWDGGGGLVGWIIRRFSWTGKKMGSAVAHCWVFVAPLPDGRWVTHETYPGGCRETSREPSSATLVLRVARSDLEVADGLRRSYSLLGRPYGYGEIARIIARRLRLPIPGFDGDALICSNHCYQVVQAARQPEPDISKQPDALALSARGFEITPAQLANDLLVLSWNDAFGNAPTKIV